VKTYTREELDSLIACAKVIAEPPRKEMRSDRGHRRNDMRLSSQNGDHEFSVFMRINETFPENFTIGLNYYPKDERGSLCLLRCKGPHGEFLGHPSLPHAHFLYHVHRAKPENIESGMRPERGGEAADAYASFQEALRHFLLTVNVIDADDHFPGFRQATLFELEDPAS